MPDTLTITTADCTKADFGWYEIDEIDHDGPVVVDVAKLRVKGYASFGGYARFGGDARFGGYLIAPTIYWFGMIPPVCDGAIKVGKVRPHESTRDYWAHRFGKRLNGCWQVIESDIAPIIAKLIDDPKWTPTERWILASHLPDGELKREQFDVVEVALGIRLGFYEGAESAQETPA